MQQLDPVYLMEISRQLAFLGAFLGGFAATFLGTLTISESEGKAALWAIGGATLSSVSFIVAVIAATMLATVLHPKAPAAVAAQDGITAARIASGIAFSVGTYALLFSIGVSGSLHSRTAGRITSVIAVVAAVLVSWAIAGF